MVHTDISELYLTHDSPQISGSSLTANFLLGGCAAVKCAVKYGTKETDCKLSELVFSESMAYC